MTDVINLDLQRVAFGNRAILHPLSLHVRPGELVALIGPNGAGKTTLLRSIAGLVPWQGRLRIQGEDAAKFSAARRAQCIAYLEQNGSIHWPLLVRDIVSLGRLPFANRGAALSVQDREHVDRILETCCLEHLSERPATELSGGERARVLLARALAVDAPLLLADEPVSALDPALQIATMQILKDQADAGRAVIVVMHDLGLALRFASRFVAMSQGHIRADGPPDSLLASGALDHIFGIRFLRAQSDGIELLAAARRQS